MRLYAIVDRDSGRYLGVGKHPSYIEIEDNLPPRLFSTSPGAKAALAAWREGHWSTEKAWEGTDEYGSGFYYQGLPVPLTGEVNAALSARRKAMNLAVVEVKLDIVS